MAESMRPRYDVQFNTGGGWKRSLLDFDVTKREGKRIVREMRRSAYAEKFRIRYRLVMTTQEVVF